MRDLIEAGLSEPVDARETYGISAITLITLCWGRMPQCRDAGGCDAGLSAQVAMIVAPIDNLGRLRSDTSARRVGLERPGVKRTEDLPPWAN